MHTEVSSDLTPLADVQERYTEIVARQMVELPPRCQTVVLVMSSCEVDLELWRALPQCCSH